MRPYGYDERELLRLAHERADDLARDWRLANTTTKRPRTQGAAGGGILESARLGAGRTLIGLGTMLLPHREPCA